MHFKNRLGGPNKDLADYVSTTPFCFPFQYLNVNLPEARRFWPFILSSYYLTIFDGWFHSETKLYVVLMPPFEAGFLANHIEAASASTNQKGCFRGIFLSVNYCRIFFLPSQGGGGGVKYSIYGEYLASKVATRIVGFNQNMQGKIPLASWLPFSQSHWAVSELRPIIRGRRFRVSFGYLRTFARQVV